LHQNYKPLSKTKLLTVQNVKIDLYHIDEGWRFSITPSTDNEGFFEWVVDPSLEAKAGYFVKVSSTSNPGVFGDSELFSIITSETETHN
jgi:hypothetical protein